MPKFNHLGLAAKLSGNPLRQQVQGVLVGLR
jgi:hypothetical protein